MKTGVQSGESSRAIPEKKAKTRWERMKKKELQLDRLVDLLEHGKLAEGKSQRLVEWYRAGIEVYLRWLDQAKKPRTLEHFTVENVRAFILDLQERDAYESHPARQSTGRKLSDQTVSTYVRALRGFSSWLFEEFYTTEPVLARLKLPKVSQKVQDILTADEIVDIITSINPRTEIGARDQAIFLMLLDTGMRAGELCNLKLSDLHLDQGYAIVFGKGKKQRPVKIGSRAAKALRFYQMHWRAPAMTGENHVFVTCRGVSGPADIFSGEPGQPLQPNALGHILKRLGKAAGVPRLHAHLLRHTFACMYLLRYRDPFSLKSLLGHTTLAMTNHYCEAVRQIEVVQADTVSIIDGLDFHALDVNRRGRLPKAGKKAV